MTSPTNDYETARLLCRIIDPFSDDKTLANELTNCDWMALIAYTNRHFLSFALYSNLKYKGLLHVCPDLVAEYLNEFYRKNAERNTAILAELYDIIALLNAVDIAPVLIKGCAALCDNWYRDNASRFMTDIDLLVAPDQISSAYQTLLNNGYNIIASGDYQIDMPTQLNSDYHQLPAMKKTDSAVTIELHRKPLSTRCKQALDYATLDQHKRACDFNGALVHHHLEAYLPSIDDCMLIAIMHSEISPWQP